ncbi:hypothetical protein BKH43_08175 [Helicobacter sp. 13S00401-1]|uniref:hypothetical protein n=1 Tax=Helicobacter sp. 13S00401-1 TaxID=1905758 RepID=UPI000BA78C5C|nr:hypothetical protein [Helicobacter sp. 13S00401-1]PAF47616.1 hypothetical protein BKH43_08175 [Helicobacter sp. 13S00401-1]
MDMIKKALLATGLIASFTTLTFAKETKSINKHHHTKHKEKTKHNIESKSITPKLDPLQSSPLKLTKLPTKLEGFNLSVGLGAGFDVDAFYIDPKLQAVPNNAGIKTGYRSVYGGSWSVRLGAGYFISNQVFGSTVGLEASFSAGSRIINYKLKDLKISLNSDTTRTLDSRVYTPEYSLGLNLIQIFGKNKIRFGYSLGAGVAFIDPKVTALNYPQNVTLRGSAIPITKFNPNLIAIFDPNSAIAGVGFSTVPVDVFPVQTIKAVPIVSFGLLTMIDAHHKISLEYKYYINSYIDYSSTLSLNYAYYFGI